MPAVLATIAGLLLFAGALLAAIPLLRAVNRRLLWRVRRKLTLSYIFIGVVPAILIVTFFLLCGLLLFFNVGGYMVRSRADVARRRGAVAGAARGRRSRRRPCRRGRVEDDRRRRQIPAWVPRERRPCRAGERSDGSIRPMLAARAVAWIGTGRRRGRRSSNFRSPPNWRGVAGAATESPLPWVDVSRIHRLDDR